MTKKTPNELPERSPRPDRPPQRGRRELVTLIPGDLVLEHPDEVAKYMFRQLRRRIEEAKDRDGVGADAQADGDVTGADDDPGLDQSVLRKIAARDLARGPRAGGNDEDRGGAA